MKLQTLLITAGTLVAFVWARQASHPAPAHRLHVSNSFEFNVHAQPSVVAPLFGAHRERGWAEGWDPQFVFPQPAEDRTGEVFIVKHGGHDSTWVNTALDLEKGHIQYVYVIPDAMAVLIDIRVVPRGMSDTYVKITYERTALSPELNDHVRKQGESDANSADHWQKAIEYYLNKENQPH